MSPPDRIPSDHPSVETVRAAVARHGGRRLRIEIPGDESARFPEPGTVVRVVVGDHTRFARIDPGHSPAHRWISGVYDSPTYARSPDAQGAVDRLAGWLDDRDRSIGRSVLIDVIEPGFAYGLREPGERTVYRSVERPSDSLASIARTLDDRR